MLPRDLLADRGRRRLVDVHHVSIRVLLQFDVVGAHRVQAKLRVQPRLHQRVVVSDIVLLPKLFGRHRLQQRRFLSSRISGSQNVRGWQLVLDPCRPDRVSRRVRLSCWLHGAYGVRVRDLLCCKQLIGSGVRGWFLLRNPVDPGHMSRWINVPTRQHHSRRVQSWSVLQRGKRSRHGVSSGILLRNSRGPGSVSSWIRVRWKHNLAHAMRSLPILPAGKRRCCALRRRHVLRVPGRQRDVHSRFILSIWKHSGSGMCAGLLLSKRNGSV